MVSIKKRDSENICGRSHRQAVIPLPNTQNTSPKRSGVRRKTVLFAFFMYEWYELNAEESESLYGQIWKFVNDSF
jgi:hypothetical protein